MDEDGWHRVFDTALLALIIAAGVHAFGWLSGFGIGAAVLLHHRHRE